MESFGREAAGGGAARSRTPIPAPIQTPIQTPVQTAAARRGPAPDAKPGAAPDPVPDAERRAAALAEPGAEPGAAPEAAPDADIAAALAALRATVPAPLPRRPWARGLKRVFDLCAVLLAAPLALPLTALMALCAAIGQPGDRGAPIYGHKRVGRRGRIFTCWKIRTMVRDADARLAAHLAADPAAAAEWARNQKLHDDPRVTRCGRVLRAISLDELPQLWNVLTGDMSLVGPRPFTPEQAPLYPAPAAYLALRPGLTGPWQVHARNADGFAARAGYDAAYLRGLSLAGDLDVMLRTVAVVLRARGL